MITRKQYMNKEFTFAEYYGQFSSEHVMAAVANYIGPERLLKSTDEHLNDIPLSIWDASPWFGMQRAVAEANQSTQAPGSALATSLSDKGCAVKAAARKWIEAQKDENLVEDTGFIFDDRRAAE